MTLFNSTIAAITVRALLGRRRFLLLFPLPLLLVGLALLLRLLAVDPHDWAPHVLVGLGFTVVLPVIALIVGVSVVGAEIDDGTLVHILAKPLPRREILLTKLTVAVAVTTLTAGVPLFVAGLLAGSTRLGIGVAVGAALGALAYSALFVALSLVTRRPVLLGLLYLLIWESALSNLLSGTRVLSVRQHAVAVADAVADSDLISGTLSTPVSVVVALVITVGATALATDRLRSFSVAGETG